MSCHRVAGDCTTASGPAQARLPLVRGDPVLGSDWSTRRPLAADARLAAVWRLGPAVGWGASGSSDQESHLKCAEGLL